MIEITFTLFIYLFLWVVFYGWGKITFTFFGIISKCSKYTVMTVWIGWAATIFLLQTLHFFAPINAKTTVPIFIIGIIYAVFHLVSRKYDFFNFRQRLQNPIRIVFISFIVLVISAWVAARAMLNPSVYDSGLYHFNTIRWINTYAIVPGLGNLHGRLAFNQSFFTYVASLNFFPYFNHGRSLANSFLFLLVIVTLIPSFISIISRPSLLIETHPFRYAFDFFILPVVVFLGLSSNGIASPSPDLTSTLLQLVIFTVLIHGIEEWNDGQKKQDYRAFFLIVMATTAVTIKLSNLVFSASIIVFALAYTWHSSHHRYRSIMIILIPPFIITLVLIFRGYILSGAPLYPSTIGYISLDWSVPIDKVINEANCVFSWARQPRNHWSKVLGSWDWLEPWFSNISKSNSKRCFVLYPFFIAIVTYAMTFLIRYFKKCRGIRYNESAVLIPLISGLIYWFFTAPDPRFAHALFYLFSISSILLFLLTMRHTVATKTYCLIFFTFFLIGSFPFLGYEITHISNLKSVSISGWQTVRTVSLKKQKTNTGILVYTPMKGDQCWDSPLPSTPYFNSSLRLRVPW